MPNDDDWPQDPGIATLAVTDPERSPQPVHRHPAQRRPAGPSANRGGGSIQQRVLVTGGAGFIGTHVVDRLLARGCRVRVLDRLDPQVHGQGATVPRHLDPAAEFIRCDVADADAVEDALEGVGRVIHLAAAVGVGQSMYAPAAYTRDNDLGTAVLLEALARRKGDIRRLVVASSMSIYGEGRYRDAEGRPVPHVTRSLEDLQADRWDPTDQQGRPLVPVPTDEDKPADTSSVYALNKWVQERMSLMMGAAYGIPTTAFRFFNVYGPRQSLSNPYTGVMAIFAGRLLNGHAPLVFEDGKQQRDFVSVHDIADAVAFHTLDDDAATGVFNLGSGEAVTVLGLAARLARVLGRSDLEPRITGEFRVGDIRHCFADITRARQQLGYAPRVSQDDAIAELAGWLEGETADDRVDQAHAELRQRGLTV